MVAAVVAPMLVVAAAISGHGAGSAASAGTVVLGPASPVRLPTGAVPAPVASASVAVPSASPSPVPTSGGLDTVPVTVLNNSTITGLAHRVAGRLQHLGLRVGAVGNLSGLVPETTLYYAAGDRSLADQLRAELPSVRRVQPVSAAGLPGSGLTLVLTADWGSP